MGKHRLGLILLLPILGLFISVSTLKDYGVNWDTLQHLVRGQIYYRFFTTGKKDFIGVIKPSYYETTVLNFAWTEKMTIGHPPLTDILLAASNHLFYKALGWLPDIQAYHVLIVILTFFCSLTIAVWSYQTLGFFASAISVLAFYTYPLLFAEQHFNLKDPAIASYFTFFLYFLWLGIEKKKSIFILVSAIFAGVSLGTKFNIFFAIPIVLIWIFFLIGSYIGKTKSICKALKRAAPLSVWIAIVSIPVISFVIFFLSYPALWNNPIKNIVSVFAYYENIGRSRCLYAPLTGPWILKCSDVHTLKLFATTFPIGTVALAITGFLISFFLVPKHTCVFLLWAVWFAVTIGRSTLPITSLYGGGLRQIMELAPAVALLSGLGAWHIRLRLQKIFSTRSQSRKIILYVAFFILLFAPVISSMIRLHPNENLYYNELIGGLKGAVIRGYPVSINTYGNGYKQAIDWINENVPYGAKVFLLEGITSAVPSYMFRPDIEYRGSAEPLFQFDQAYLMELSQPGMDILKYHNSLYANAFLVPVFEKKVDGVPIVNVWKNDKDHANLSYDYTSEKILQPKTLWRSNDEIILDLGNNEKLKRLEAKTDDENCTKSVRSTYTLVSLDGISFNRLYPATGEFAQAAEFYKNKATVLFTGQTARFIKLFSFADTHCDWSSVEFHLVAFPQS